MGKLGKDEPSVKPMEFEIDGVIDELGKICPEIDELRCGVTVMDRPTGGGNIVAATGETTGHVVAAGRKLVITCIELLTGSAGDYSLKIYDGDPATANFLGAVALASAAPGRINCWIMVNAVAGALTPWLDIGTTSDPDLNITGVEWTEKTA